MLKVFVAQNPMEAHLLLGLLEAAGIHAELRGEALFTTIQGGSAAPGMLPSVWIQSPDQEPAARALVDRYTLDPAASAAANPGGGWVCAGCGEAHEAQFSHCWKCGQAGEALAKALG